MFHIRNYVRRHPVKTQRFLEILPGFVSWSLILFPFWGSLVMPTIVAYYIITFSVYWLYRSASMALLAVIAHYRIKASMRNDWMKDLEKFPDWKKIHHIIVIPTYKEPVHILKETLEKLATQTFPVKNIHIMLSFEDREGEEAREKSKVLENEFGKIFGNLWATFHPDIPGEVKGKSSNTAWGARAARKLLDPNILTEDITISSEDADARFHSSYFAALTYEYLHNPHRFDRIWQGSIRFYNNIWRVPAPVRVLASIFSVTQMFILMRQDRLINFSTYSTSMKLIEDIGYWDTNVVPEDYHLFFKAYFARKGKLEVEPIFLPILADAAEAKGFWATMTNQYEQIKRWAWGVSDDAYIIKQWILAENVPFWDKTIRVLKTVEDHFLWPVNWFAITVGALLPPLLNQQFNRTVIGKTLPQVSSALLTMSLVSLIAIFLIDAASRPPRPKDTSIFARIFQPFEFLLLPILGFFFSALPGIDAHTRLMLGKYMEYRVTEKV
ncbi:MAG TPA: glycosyltransferase family 2 protein [Patescibacteria group bacterium]|nr:glycosyltransferase family 2 protein [Patescibacteria group bacterium]